MIGPIRLMIDTFSKTSSKTLGPEGTMKLRTRSKASVDREYAACKYDGDGGEDSDRIKTNGRRETLRLRSDF